MSCYHPMPAVRFKVDGHDDQIRFVDRWRAAEYEKNGAEVLSLPCGRCIGCRLDQARAWSTRAQAEQKCWPESWFVTCTYDDENLTFGAGVPTLVPKEAQDFLKRLRFHFSERGVQPVRTLYCGEYGSRSFRPHFHFLLFNLPLDDLTYYSRSDLGDVYYNSKTLSDLWQRGFVVVAEVTPQSASYVARYVQKKAEKEVDYEKIGVEREFLRASRRPGLGWPYFEAHFGEILQNDTVVLSDGIVSRPGAYFDRRAKDLGLASDVVAARRKKVAAALQSLAPVQPCSVYYDSYLEDLEQEFVKNRSRYLTRPL